MFLYIVCFFSGGREGGSGCIPVSVIVTNGRIPDKLQVVYLFIY